MIDTYRKLSDVLKYERTRYFHDDKDYIRCKVLKNSSYQLFQWQKMLRCSEYHMTKKRNIIHYLLWIICSRKKNRMGLKLGVDIPENVFSEGLRIYHPGAICVNSHARVGKDCIIVGNVCIGNKNGMSIAPVIGDCCMLGYGCTVIGDITLGNNISVAAGAVVTKTYREDGTVLVGIPAHQM